jgi:GTP-binding protein
VVVKEKDGEKQEPMELLTIHIPESFSGKVIEIVSQRKGEIINIENKNGRTALEFKIPARGMIGINNLILTSTEGEAVINHRFHNYESWKGDILNRNNGSLIAMETGTAIPYSIEKLQDRGSFFIEPNEKVYAGQVIGENTRQEDLLVNVTKTKKLTNFRAAGSDEKTVVTPPTKFSLEEAMEYIKKDEYIEVTPRSIRLRKIILDEHERKRLRKSEASA